MSNYLSYKQIFQDRIKFRQAGTANGSDWSNYDFPDALYFRILFHFYNKPGSGIDNNEGYGLLHPTWQLIDGKEDGENAWVKQTHNEKRALEYLPWRYNTAYSYLITNDEQERAQYLKHFITLLSNINSESPWYFKSVKGIEEAINRKQFTEVFEFKERGRLTIECMPDSFDQRIGTMLDLYRAATYSWANKREIIPTNLRKFDMTVIVFQSPIQRMHMPNSVISQNTPNLLGQVSSLMFEPDINFATLDYKQNGPAQASYKIYEFHNCEFDYNSTIAAGDGLINEEPFNTTYNIGIFYDDMYESRYNQFIQFEPVKILTATRTANQELSSYEKQYEKQVAEAQSVLSKYNIQQAKRDALTAKSAKTEELETRIAEVQRQINIINSSIAMMEAQKEAEAVAKEYKKYQTIPTQYIQNG